MTVTGIEHQKMNMVGRYCVIEDYKSIAFFRLIQPLHPALTILAELEQKLPLVTPVRQMPHLTGEVVPLRSCHIANHLL
jgi:hypothetical protein